MRAPTAVPFRVAPFEARRGGSGGSGGLAPALAEGKLQPNEARGWACHSTHNSLQITTPASWVTNIRARSSYHRNVLRAQ